MKVIININDGDIAGVLTLLRMASKEFNDPKLDGIAENCKGKEFELVPEDFGDEAMQMKVAMCAFCLSRSLESDETHEKV